MTRNRFSVVLLVLTCATGRASAEDSTSVVGLLTGQPPALSSTLRIEPQQSLKARLATRGLVGDVRGQGPVDLTETRPLVPFMSLETLSRPPLTPEELSVPPDCSRSRGVRPCDTYPLIKFEL